MLFCNSIVSARTIYVDDDASGLNDGSSWENAYIYLQDALTEAKTAEKPIEIRVAQGTYTPDKGANVATGNFYEFFELINGVTISGGFCGLGPYDSNQPLTGDERNIELYPTILSGDLLGNDSNDYDPNNIVTEPTFSENSLNVVWGSFTDETSVLDGFIITAGNARGNNLDYGYTFNSTTRGGGIYIESSIGGPVITNCTFVLNAAYEGGAIYNNNSDPNISNCKFIKNSANYYYETTPIPVAGNGGAICSLQGNAILTNCEFIENLASTGAGVFINKDVNMVIKDCNFTLNTANMDYGGGISIYMSNPIIKDCKFYDNNSVKLGGGIANIMLANPVIDNCIFQENHTKGSGGAIYNSYQSEPNIINCIFTSNIAVTLGGAIINQNSDPNLINCIFSGNHAQNSGAFDNAYGNPTFYSCIFSNNSAGNGGVMQNFSGNILLKNCIFSGNTASNSGAILNTGGNATLINCTATGNYAGDLGPFAQNLKSPPPFVPGNFQILNCIIWNGENAIYNQSGSSIEINYSNIQNGPFAINDPQHGLNWGIGNIDKDPLFIEPGFWVDVNDPNIIVEPDDPNAFWLEGDYHLKSAAGHYDPNSKTWMLDDVNSPSLDTGDPNSLIENETLPNGNRINMGAYGGTNQASLSRDPLANKEPDGF